LIIKMNRSTFDFLKDTDLPKACFDPIIPLIRAKGMDVKEEVYSQLTEGQEALFLYNAYFNHASKSLAEFYWWSAYYYAQPKIWSALRFALHYFQTYDLNQLLTEIEANLEVRDYPRNLETYKAAYNDLDHNQDLLDDFTALFSKLNSMTPGFQQTIGEVIRYNPSEFIHLEEENI
jgi:hypothetical protein